MTGEEAMRYRLTRQIRHDQFDCLVLVAPAQALAELRHALDSPHPAKIVAQLQKHLAKELGIHIVTELRGKRISIGNPRSK